MRLDKLISKSPGIVDYGVFVLVHKISYDIPNAVLEWIYCPDTSEPPGEFYKRIIQRMMCKLQE